MKTIGALITAIIFLINGSLLSGYDSSKSMSKKGTQDSKNPGTFVYLHSDRSYYLPGESVLFKAYFLDNLNNRSYPVNDTLNVSILDQDGLEVANGKFPVTNNLISGKIDLPDLLSEGNYILFATTRSMNNLPPEKMFSRIIEIRKSLENYLITDISLTDTVYLPGSTLTAQIMFSGKDGKPVPASFAYQLSRGTVVILNGNNKANNEGKASLNLQLPKFDNTETLKLFIMASNKGTKNITGIVIPTEYNYPSEKTHPATNLSSNDLKHLNIQIKPVNLSNQKDDDIRLDIAVTDDKGTPVMTNLSASVTNIIPNQLPFENDNIISHANRKNIQTEASRNQDVKKFFTQYLLKETQSPGHAFIVQEKNSSKKLTKKQGSVNQKNQYGYSGDRNIFDILMQIKPYHLENGKIVFGTNNMNSINSQDGALIIVDGVKMGTDASILNTIPVPDIARITASTNSMDMQRYSAMNSFGIIEISMKKTNEYLKNEETSAKAKSSTLFWGPEILTDSSGKASISFSNNNKSTEMLISVEGISANGVYGSCTIRYSAK